MAVFTPAEEVERTLVAPWDLAEKVVRDFFREERVEEPGITMLTEDLGEVLVLMDGEEVVVLMGEEVVVAGEGTLVEAVEVLVLMVAEEVVVAGEDTLVEAVEVLNMTPVGEGEVPSMMEQTKRMNVVTTQLAMVR